MMRLISFMAVLMAGPAAAQSNPDIDKLMHYMDGVRPCLAAAVTRDEALQCIGDGSGTCMETEENGYSTHGMMFCTFAELDAWDVLLNEEYAKARDRARRWDANTAESFPEFAVRADALRDAQRAWIAFRDADCALAYAEFGEGSMRHIVGSGCMLQMTAERTIDLKFLFAEM